VLVPADLTATATLILAGITLVLAAATVALVLVTRAGTAQARADARLELRMLERQVGSGYRPLLVDVLTTAAVPDDIGAQYEVDRNVEPNQTVRYAGPVIETKLPGMEPRWFDPRFVFVDLQAGRIFISVPLRNVGRGLAVIDGGDVELTGASLGSVRYRTIQRDHIPVGETTRVDLILTYLRQQAPDLAEQGHTMRGVAWQLMVPYCDFAGEQRTVAHLRIVCRGDEVTGPWVVERVQQESAPDHEPQERRQTAGEVPDAAASPQPGGRRRLLDVKTEPVTDVWGNPNKPRRRKR
jgi:hypothetical protein